MSDDKCCLGRTPLQTFRETKHLADQKRLERQFQPSEPELPAVTTPPLLVVS